MLETALYVLLGLCIALCVQRVVAKLTEKEGEHE